MAALSLRVLHAIHDFLPQVQAGSEIYAFELCRELLNRGHHVTLVCAAFDPARQHGHVTWRVVGGLPVVEIVNNWTGATFEDTYRDPVITSRLASVLDAVQPDIVHIHNLLNLSFDFPRLVRQRGIRSVATLHDYTLVCPAGGQRIHTAESHVCHSIEVDRCARCFGESPFGARAAWGRFANGRPFARALTLAARTVRLAMPNLAVNAAARLPSVAVSTAVIEERLQAARSLFDEIDLFVAPSESMRSEFVSLGVPAERIKVSDYGFRSIETRREPGPGDGPLRIGFVGTLVWHKGVHVLIDALRDLPAGRYSVEIFGDLTVFPAYVADLRQRAAELPVRFAGPFAPDDRADAYRSIDVLVVPSIWLENSPLVIHEAFMAGVPVVGSDIGGIPGLVHHGENGLLFSAGDASALGGALRSLVDDRGLLERLAARRTPIKTIDEDAAEWEAAYSSLAVDSLTLATS